MAKVLHKSIVKRPKLRNPFCKSKNFSDGEIQQTFCKKLSKNTQRTSFGNSDTNKVTDNRMLMKPVLPLFSDKFLKIRK